MTVPRFVDQKASHDGEADREAVGVPHTEETKETDDSCCLRNSCAWEYLFVQLHTHYKVHIIGRFVESFEVGNRFWVGREVFKTVTNWYLDCWIYRL